MGSLIGGIALQEMLDYCAEYIISDVEDHMDYINEARTYE
jgi:hypothetical protein